MYKKFGLISLLLLPACESSPTQPVITQAAVLTVDASAGFAYVRLGSPAKLVTPADPAHSSDWDIAVFATSVMLNGGAAGPAGVRGACLCRAEPSVADLQRMTAVTELARFDSVRVAMVPADGSFMQDALAPAISGWFTGTAAAGNVTAAPGNSFIVREGTTAPVFAKVHVTAIQGATATNPGKVTLEYAVQPSPDAAFGATKTIDITVGATPVYFDLTTGAITTSTNWDLEFDGYSIRVNGGVSGGGTVRAVLVSSTAFASITSSLAGSVPASVYAGDAFAGIYGSKPWYRYNILGTDNQIWPTYDVYIIRRGTETYKVQLTGYYDTTGKSRQITIRYAPL